MTRAVAYSQISLIASFPRKKNCHGHQSRNTEFTKVGTISRNEIFRSSFPSQKIEKIKSIHVMTPETSPSITIPKLLEVWDDDYNGVVVNSENFPMSSNAFVSAFRASMSDWKLKGKKGVWLKLPREQAELVPIAIQEGFNYHHAESGYVMLTYWIPDDLSLLPGSPSHHIGVCSFVINDKKEVLIVKEKCPCSFSDVWKLPTGYIDKSEDIFCGATREVKEETGIDTRFLHIVAFRHAHNLAFENSDLLFVCMLKPLSSEITIDETEIQDAMWMGIDEFIEQPFYEDDPMSKKVVDICMAARDRGYIGHQITSKLDTTKLTYLYYKC